MEHNGRYFRHSLVPQVSLGNRHFPNCGIKLSFILKYSLFCCVEGPVEQTSCGIALFVSPLMSTPVCFPVCY